jgi:RimJ/RimL family protein N-acetyltransferase
MVPSDDRVGKPMSGTVSTARSGGTGGSLNATRRVRLRPLGVDDYVPLLELEAAPDVLSTWRLRGGVPADMAAYEWSLWQAIADQRILERVDDGSLLGLAQLYNVDARLGVGWLSIIVVPSARGTGAAMDGLGLFLYRCFTTWGLRRVYFTALQPNLAAFASITKRAGCSLYGTLKERTFLDGEPVDVSYGGIDGAEWLAHYEPILRRLAKSTGN